MTKDEARVLLNRMRDASTAHVHAVMAATKALAEVQRAQEALDAAYAARDAAVQARIDAEVAVEAAMIDMSDRLAAYEEASAAEQKAGAR